MNAIWTQIKALNRSKITHGITLAFAISIAVLVALKSGLGAETKIEVEIGLVLATLTRFQFLWQKVVPLLDGSTVVQTSPPTETRMQPSLVSVAVDPAQVVKKDAPSKVLPIVTDVESPPTAPAKPRGGAGYIIPLVLGLGIAIGLMSCKTTPTTPDDFFGRVVTCTEQNTESAAAANAVLVCLVNAVGGDYAACLAGLVTGGHWTVDEIACIVRGYATGAATRLNSGTATSTDAATLANANAWLRAKQIGFR